MKKKVVVIVIGIIVAAFIAYYLISPAFRVIEANDAMPNRESEEQNITTIPGVLASGDFIASAHEVQGRVLLIESGGKKIIRFEDFETINGPDLRIYLSADTTNNDFIDLGEIKATKGNVNYDIPTGTDTEKYNNVLVWCRAFRVLFSHADLS